MTGSLFGEETPGAAGPALEMITAYCDGGSRGNPGPSGYGVSIEGPRGERVAELNEFLGVKTNNFAEYSALLAALEFALAQGHKGLRVVADSELMVKQIKGQYQVKSPELRPLYDEAKRRIARLGKFQIEHVLRNKNKRADALANEAMDKGSGKTVRIAAAAKPSAGPAPAGPPAGPPTGPKIEIASRPAPRPPAAAVSGQVFRGFVKNGVVHLLEGELPENAFVKVTVGVTTPPSQPARRTLAIALLLFLVRIPFLLLHHVQEDAYITFRTARHLAEQGDFSYNLHQHFPATTSLLYPLIVAVIDLLARSHLVLGVQVFGTLCVITGSYLAARALPGREEQGRDKQWQAAWLLLGCWPVSLVVSYTGMETPLLLLALGCRVPE